MSNIWCDCDILQFLCQYRLGVTANDLRRTIQIVGEFHMKGFGCYLFPVAFRDDDTTVQYFMCPFLDAFASTQQPGARVGQKVAGGSERRGKERRIRRSSSYSMAMTPPRSGTSWCFPRCVRSVGGSAATRYRGGAPVVPVVCFPCPCPQGEQRYGTRGVLLGPEVFSLTKYR